MGVGGRDKEDKGMWMSLSPPKSFFRTIKALLCHISESHVSRIILRHIMVGRKKKIQVRI
jgi:hypothetical protein